MRSTLLLLLSMVSISSPLGAATILFSEFGPSLPLNTVIEVDLMGIQFDQPTVGGGVDIQFDPSMLNILSIRFDKSDFEFVTETVGIDNNAGRVESLLVSSLEPLPNETFTIATLQLQILGPGTSVLDLQPPTFFAPWLNASGADLTPTLQDSNITAVPIPPAIVLFLSGIAMLLRNKQN